MLVGVLGVVKKWVQGIAKSEWFNLSTCCKSQGRSVKPGDKGYLRALISPREPRHAAPDRFLIPTVCIHACKPALLPRTITGSHQIRQHHPRNRGTQRNRVIMHDQERNCRVHRSSRGAGAANNTVKVTSGGPVPQRIRVSASNVVDLFKSPWKIR